jgi:glyceraldehyde 3-phosphate dehydrogenase
MENVRKINVGINGLGRIGRAFLKLAFEKDFAKSALNIVAVNDLGDLDNLAYLMKYDSAYGRSNLEVEARGGKLVINGTEIEFSQEKDTTKLPWGKLGVDVVLEATGVFESFEKCKAHISAGAKRVVISAPAKDEPAQDLPCGTVLMGVNEDDLKNFVISSNASCTTNSISPVIQILKETVGVEKALLNTVHAYTATQKLVDSPDAKDFRRGRAGAQNIAPSTTGAAKALGKVMKDLDGMFDGIALRVPVIAGSMADVTFISKRPTSREEINEILKKAASDSRWKGIFKVTEEQLVSADIIGDSYASIADIGFTKVVGGNLVKVLAWYDNEMGYTYTLLDHVIKTGSHLK